jgi:hypothetical protein
MLLRDTIYRIGLIERAAREQAAMLEVDLRFLLDFAHVILHSPSSIIFHQLTH